MKIITIGLLLLTSTLYSQKFDTLTSFQEYANSLEEYPAYTNKNPLDPDYNKYYDQFDRSRIGGWLDEAWSFFGYEKTHKMWPVREFGDLL